MLSATLGLHLSSTRVSKERGKAVTLDGRGNFQLLLTKFETSTAPHTDSSQTCRSSSFNFAEFFIPFDPGTSDSMHHSTESNLKV